MKKKCFKCGKTKDIEQFYKHKQMADGHLGKCKVCTKNDVNSRYKDPLARERIVAYEKARFQTAHRRAKVLEYARARRKRKPGKERARSKLARAVKNGTIIRKPCEVCGDTKSQGHHTDYRKALDVKWLCFRHHREEHGQKVS